MLAFALSRAGLERGCVAAALWWPGSLMWLATNLPAPHARLGTRRTDPCSSVAGGDTSLAWCGCTKQNGNNNLWLHRAGVVFFS